MPLLIKLSEEYLRLKARVKVLQRSQRQLYNLPALLWQ